MPTQSRHFARQSAVQALYQWDLTEQAPEDIEKHFISRHELTGGALEYFRHLVEEVPLHHQELDSHLEPFLDRDFQQVDPVERAILRVATYELEYESDVPFKVILDEAIKLSKTFGAEHGYKFVNAVLDRLAVKLRPPEES
jgi:N utilization substance protein B